MKGGGGASISVSGHLPDLVVCPRIYHAFTRVGTSTYERARADTPGVTSGGQIINVGSMQTASMRA